MRRMGPWAMVSSGLGAALLGFWLFGATILVQDGEPLAPWYVWGLAGCAVSSAVVAARRLSGVGRAALTLAGGLALGAAVAIAAAREDGWANVMWVTVPAVLLLMPLVPERSEEAAAPSTRTGAGAPEQAQAPPVQGTRRRERGARRPPGPE